jgi:putative phage-type endonuclease
MTTISAEWIDRSLPDIKPGSAEWMRYMSASKIAAVMAHSTYDSRFSLWHRMKGNILPDPEDDQTRRGHYLEPAIIAWFKDQHPDWTFHKTGMWVHPEITEFSASPDGIAHTPDGPVLVEAKSSLDVEFGKPGTDEVPAGFRDQAIWQMLVTGMRKVYMPMIGTGLQFAEYVVEWDEEYAGKLMFEAGVFMQTLKQNIKPSIDPLDGHTQTYKALKELAHGINGETIYLDDEQALAFLHANQDMKDAEYRVQAAKNVIAEHAGEARYVAWSPEPGTEHRMFTRQSRGEGTPYLVASKKLPQITKDTK